MNYEKRAGRRKQGGEISQSSINFSRFFTELLPPLSSLLTTFPPWNDKTGVSLRAPERCVAIPF